MPSTAEQIANAAKARLDAISGSLSASFTSSVDLDGRSTAGSATTTAAVVITPLGRWSWERGARSSVKNREHTLAIAIKRKETSEASLSGFMQLVEEICEDLAQQSLAGFVWQRLDAEEPFDIEQFQKTGVASFTAELEYKGIS